MSPGVAAAIVGVCLLTEGFFSGSEIAIVAADRLKLRARADAGERGAALVLKLLEHPERLLGTCLIGTNLSTVSASTAATAAVASALPEAGAALTVALLFPLILLFGELIPKSIYQHYADRIAPVIAFPLRLASLCLWPILVVLEALTGVLTGASGETTRPVTRADIVLLLEGSEEVQIDADDRELIQRVFEFGSATVEDAMKPLIEVNALPQDATALQAITLMVARGHSRIPIFDGRIDRVTGVVHHDALLHCEDMNTPLKDLARAPFFVPETKRLEQLFLELNQSRKHIAIPVDEYGGAVGLITMEDILEEIVGDIRDETDAPSQPITQLSENLWQVSARVEREILEERLGLELPDGDFETLAGFMLAQLGHVPKVGEQTRHGLFSMEVSRASDRAILQVRIRRS